jgi:hypothetical protein
MGSLAGGRGGGGGEVARREGKVTAIRTSGGTAVDGGR